jgi:hypothetical protein
MADGDVATHDSDQDFGALVDLSPAPRAEDLGAWHVRHAVQVGPTATYEGELSNLSERHG